MIFDGDHKTERRITLRLLHYWEKLRQGRSMPAAADIKQDDISDLWDHCFLVHTEHLGKEDYRFTYLGAAVLKAYHGGLSGDDAKGRISPHSEQLTTHYAQIMKTMKPLVEEGEFVNLNNQIVKYRQCLVPLGQDGRVEAIFGGMRYKIFSA